jgi:hypothetical protein
MSVMIKIGKKGGKIMVQKYKFLFKKGQQRLKTFLTVNNRY